MCKLKKLHSFKRLYPQKKYEKNENNILKINLG